MHGTKYMCEQGQMSFGGGAGLDWVGLDWIEHF